MSFLLIFYKMIDFIADDYKKKVKQIESDKIRAKLYNTSSFYAEVKEKESILPQIAEVLSFLEDFKPIVYMLVRMTHDEHDCSELTPELNVRSRESILTRLTTLLSTYKRLAPEAHPVLFYLMANPFLQLFDSKFPQNKPDGINRYFTPADYKHFFELPNSEVFRTPHLYRNFKNQHNSNYIQLNNLETHAPSSKPLERDDPINTSYFLTYFYYIFLRVQAGHEPIIIANDLIESFQRILKQDLVSQKLIFAEDSDLLQEKVLFIQETKIKDLEFLKIQQNPLYHHCFFNKDNSERIIDRLSIQMMKQYEAFKFLLLSNIKLDRLSSDFKQILGEPIKSHVYRNSKIIPDAVKIQQLLGCEIYTKLILHFIKKLVEKSLGAVDNSSSEALRLNCQQTLVPDDIANLVNVTIPMAFTELLEFINCCSEVSLAAKFVDEITNYPSYAEFRAEKLPELMLSGESHHMPLNEDYLFNYYKTPSKDLIAGFIPEEQLLRESIRNTLAIKRYLIDLKTKSIKELFDILGSNLRCYKKDKGGGNEIWGGLLELFKRTHGFYLNTVQIINAHLILNSSEKLIAQIKTGEGKSALFTVMLAFKALTTGRKQFFITSADNLALRDLITYKEYYRLLGLSSSSNVPQRPDDRTEYMNPESFKGNIVYGTPFSFQVAYMYSLNKSNPLLKSLQSDFNFSKIDLFLDEVDSILIDLESSSSRINFGNQEKVDPDNLNIYKEMCAFLEVAKPPSGQQPQLSIDAFRLHLIEKNYFNHETIVEPKNLFKTYCWFSSLIESTSMKKNVDYVISEKENKKHIVIVDKEGTGELRHSTNWANGLHQILSAREGVEITPESDCSISLRQHNFFKLFPRIFALTGSIGSNGSTSYLKNMYSGLKILTLPRYKASQAIEKKHIVCEHKTAQYNQLIQYIQDVRNHHQAALILFKTIAEVQQFADFTSQNGQPVLTLTGLEKETIKQIIGSAGIVGSVLVATLLAGRGADIVPHPDVEKNGGLLVYVCEPPANSRVIDQTFGRTGRQGRRGCYQFCFTQQELFESIIKLSSSIKSKQSSVKNEADSVVFPWNTGHVKQAQPVQQIQQHEPKDTASNLPSILKASQQPDDNATPLLATWEKLLLENEEQMSQYNLSLARYSELFFELQKLIYEINDPSIIKQFTHKHDLLLASLDIYLSSGSLARFKEFLGSMLKEIITENSAYLLATQTARSTNNQIMLDILEQSEIVDYFSKIVDIDKKIPDQMSQSSQQLPTHSFFAPRATKRLWDDEDEYNPYHPPSILDQASTRGQLPMAKEIVIIPLQQFEDNLQDFEPLEFKSLQIRINSIDDFIGYLQRSPAIDYVTLFSHARFSIELIIQTLSSVPKKYYLDCVLNSIGITEIPIGLHLEHAYSFFELLPKATTRYATFEVMPLFITLLLNSSMCRGLIAESIPEKEKQDALAMLPFNLFIHCLKARKSPKDRIDLIQLCGQFWRHMIRIILLDNPDSFGEVLSYFPESPPAIAKKYIKYASERCYPYDMDKEENQLFESDKVACLNAIGITPCIVKWFGSPSSKKQAGADLFTKIISHFSDADRDRILLRDSRLKFENNLILPSSGSCGLSHYEFIDRSSRRFQLIESQEAFVACYQLLQNQFISRLELVGFWMKYAYRIKEFHSEIKQVLNELYQEIQEKIDVADVQHLRASMQSIMRFMHDHIDQLVLNTNEIVATFSHS